MNNLSPHQLVIDYNLLYLLDVIDGSFQFCKRVKSWLDDNCLPASVHVPTTVSDSFRVVFQNEGDLTLFKLAFS